MPSAFPVSSGATIRLVDGHSAHIASPNPLRLAQGDLCDLWSRNREEPSFTVPRTARATGSGWFLARHDYPISIWLLHKRGVTHV